MRRMNHHFSLWILHVLSVLSTKGTGTDLDR